MVIKTTATRNNTYQPATNQTQTGYQTNPVNQGTNYPPQQQQQQQQTPGLPPIQIQLDAEDLLNGAGQLFKNSFSNPTGN